MTTHPLGVGFARLVDTDHNGPASNRCGADGLTNPGAGTIRVVDDHVGTEGCDVPFYRPARFDHEAPILFVMHGTKRNAADYRDTWIPAADRYGCLLLCPEFPRERFPSTAFQLGGLVDRHRAPRPRSAWTFDVVERLFDLVRDVTGNTSAGYHLYGHSAGAQFVHRLVLFLPEARYVTAVAANAGYYTMPTFADTFPYGLGQTDVTPEALGAALARRLVVLLGGEDTDADDPHLRNTRRARQQGPNRLERGRAFHAAAYSEAHRLGLPSAWDLVTVSGAAHLDADMMPTAAQLLFAPR